MVIVYILMVGIPLLAQIKIKTEYSRYSKVKNSKKLSGCEVARKILDANGLGKIYVVEVAGDFTDHYDPTRKTVRLSTNIFHGTSISAAAVAAHECGHAIQDKISYAPMRIRSMLVPAVNLVTSFSWYIVFFGIMVQIFKIFIIGIALVSLGLIFQLVTLPVEIDASRRAKKELLNLNLISESEKGGIKKVLTAAAMTYVAAVLTSILQIFRLFLVYSNQKKQ